MALSRRKLVERGRASEITSAGASILAFLIRTRKYLEKSNLRLI